MTLVDPEDIGLLARPWTVAVRPTTSYAVKTGPGKRQVRLHRLILPDAEICDHRNGDGLDNRRRNLRPATHAQNMTNRRKKRGSSSQFLGVRKKRNSWEAWIKERYIGSFATEEEAARAYDEVSRAINGEFARLNLASTV